MAEKARPMTGPEAGRRVVKKWQENLPCRLTESELWDKSMGVAKLNCEYQRVEEEKKATAKKFSEALKYLRKEMDDTSRKVIAGQEDRDVEIQEIYDIVADRVIRLRTDTGEVLLERNPTHDERQTSFEFGAAA